MACKPGRTVGTSSETDGLPHQINGTMISGVNPFFPRSALEKCCTGPITNITSPAPEKGPLSASWPSFCIAYCPTKLKLDYDDSDSDTSDAFYKCWTEAVEAMGYKEWSVVSTGVNRFGPGECVPFQETPGCTDGRRGVWESTGYVKISTSKPTVTTAMTSDAAQTDTDAEITTAATTTASNSDSKDSKDSGASSLSLSHVFVVAACLLSLL